MEMASGRATDASLLKNSKDENDKNKKLWIEKYIFFTSKSGSSGCEKIKKNRMPRRQDDCERSSRLEKHRGGKPLKWKGHNIHNHFIWTVQEKCWEPLNQEHFGNNR